MGLYDYNTAIYGNYNTPQGGSFSIPGLPPPYGELVSTFAPMILPAFMREDPLMMAGLSPNMNPMSVLRNQIMQSKASYAFSGPGGYGSFSSERLGDIAQTIAENLKISQLEKIKGFVGISDEEFEAIKSNDDYAAGIRSVLERNSGLVQGFDTFMGGRLVPELTTSKNVMSALQLSHPGFVPFGATERVLKLATEGMLEEAPSDGYITPLRVSQGVLEMARRGMEFYRPEEDPGELPAMFDDTIQEVNDEQIKQRAAQVARASKNRIEALEEIFGKDKPVAELFRKLDEVTGNLSFMGPDSNVDKLISDIKYTAMMTGMPLDFIASEMGIMGRAGEQLGMLKATSSRLALDTGLIAWGMDQKVRGENYYGYDPERIRSELQKNTLRGAKSVVVQHMANTMALINEATGANLEPGERLSESWINEGKTEQEKASRRELAEVINRVQSGDATTEDLELLSSQAPLAEIVASAIGMTQGDVFTYLGTEDLLQAERFKDAKVILSAQAVEMRGAIEDAAVNEIMSSSNLTREQALDKSKELTKFIFEEGITSSDELIEAKGVDKDSDEAASLRRSFTAIQGAFESISPTGLKFEDVVNLEDAFEEATIAEQNIEAIKELEDHLGDMEFFENLKGTPLSRIFEIMTDEPGEERDETLRRVFGAVGNEKAKKALMVAANETSEIYSDIDKVNRKIASGDLTEREVKQLETIREALVDQAKEVWDDFAEYSDSLTEEDAEEVKKAIDKEEEEEKVSDDSKESKTDSESEAADTEISSSMSESVSTFDRSVESFAQAISDFKDLFTPEEGAGNKPPDQYADTKRVVEFDFMGSANKVYTEELG